MKKYESEALSRWGDTDAYREHEQKTKNYTKEKWAEANEGLLAIFAEFAACKDSDASTDSAEAQALVAKLHSQLLCLHGRNPRRAWQDVRLRREIQEEHRQIRRRNCGICGRGNRCILSGEIIWLITD